MVQLEGPYRWCRTKVTSLFLETTLHTLLEGSEGCGGSQILCSPEHCPLSRGDAGCLLSTVFQFMLTSFLTVDYGIITPPQASVEGSCSPAQRNTLGDARARQRLVAADARVRV